MFHTSAACPASLAFAPARHLRLPTVPRLAGRHLLPLTAVALCAAMLAVPPQRAARVDQDPAPSLVHMVQAADPAALRDAAEAMRARLLGQPGVGAVRIEGLRQQRVMVEYAPARLASLGLTAAGLAAALPVDPAQSRPGALALRVADAPDSLLAVAGLPVRSASRVFRLGDVALVARAPLDPPVSLLRVGGQPAARLVVTEAR